MSPTPETSPQDQETHPIAMADLLAISYRYEQDPAQAACVIAASLVAMSVQTTAESDRKLVNETAEIFDQASLALAAPRLKTPETIEDEIDAIYAAKKGAPLSFEENVAVVKLRKDQRTAYTAEKAPDMPTILRKHAEVARLALINVAKEGSEEPLGVLLSGLPEAFVTDEAA